HMLATGMDPDGVMAELTGREGGYSKGKGGSMHMFSTETRFFGGHGIVAAQVALGAGLAFAHKYNDDGGIAVAYYGDGAANQGQVAETMNMASLWQLPILFVCENNRYAMGTSTERAAAVTDYAARGKPYGIPGARVDGMDVEAMATEAGKAIKHVRSGKGPFVLEAMTYRYRGHSMSDPAKYRTKEEVQKYRTEQDPIERLREKLLGDGIADEAALKAIDKDVKAVVAKSADFAQSSPEPSPDELYTDVTIAAA
ncbi:MAG TPA: pyruvate dehydrogenase (acetyl-transferring) E1 component subunit alpha, partial [Alphaproteobacteria bacterium]|nr:pyruvate dehydrogenase (acetyl-transferring) E1 component subunit alpha [Alphaproteobacteria bacterium]